MIIFEGIRFKNLRSVGNYWVDFNLIENKNTILVGKNGTGKSTVVDALCYASFGKRFTKTTLANLVNSVNRKGLETELYFSKGSNRYRVIRGIKPDKFEIYENDILLPQDGKKDDYQNRLNKIFGFDFKTFTNVVILGSASHTPFMQLEAKERRALVERLLDLEVFSTMNEYAKSQLKEVKAKIKDVENGIYRTELSIGNKKELKQKIADSNKETIASYLNNIKHSNEEIEKEEISKKEIQEKIDAIDIDKYINSLDRLERELNEINSNLIVMKTKNQSVAKQKSFLSNNDICPTCKQQLDNEYKEELRSQLIEEDVTAITKDVEKHEDDINKVKTYLNKIDSTKREIDKHNSIISSHRRDIELYNREIEKLNAEDASEYDDEIKILEVGLKKIKKELNELNELKGIIEISVVLLKDDGIKASIIKKYIPLINDLINFYLDKFNFFCRFEINEEFEESLKSRHVDTFTYNDFSEGEKKRLDLSILFVLKEISKRKNMVNCNLLVFDETLERIDDDAADCFVKLLRDYNTNNIVISHDDKIISKFNSRNDSITRVSKKGKFSYFINETQ